MATKQSRLLLSQKHPGGGGVGGGVGEEMGAVGWGGEGRPLQKPCKGRRGEGSTFWLMQEPSPQQRTGTKHRQLTRSFSRAALSTGTAGELEPAGERAALQLPTGAPGAASRPWQQLSWEKPAWQLQQ